MEGKHLLQYLSTDKPIVFFDVETTGLEGNGTRILELSLVKYRLDDKVETLTIRINPEIEIPPKLTELHGISNEDVKSCPTFREIAPQLERILFNCHLGGYNGIKFDTRLLEAEFKRVGVPFDLKGRAIIDPMKIYHAHVSAREDGKRRLINAYERYCNKELKDVHAAQPDVFATIEVLKSQLDKYSDVPREIYKLGDYCRRKLPEYVDSMGALIWRENDKGEWEVVLNYMKPDHRGKTLKEVIEADKEFINWVLEPKEFDYDDDLKDILRDAMKGIYPTRPR